MRRGSSDLRLIAFHEAGHAVASWALHRRVEALTLAAHDPYETAGRLPAITRDSSPEGAPRQLDEISADTPATDHVATLHAEREREIKIILAGPEAETLLTQDYDWWGCERDRLQAEQGIHLLLNLGWRPDARDEAEAELLDHSRPDSLRQGWSLLLYRTHALIRRSPARAAVFALAHALLREEELDSARAARIIRSGIASADPDLAV